MIFIIGTRALVEIGTSIISKRAVMISGHVLSSFFLHVMFIYSGGHKSDSTPIFVSHLEILSYLQNFYELKHAH